MKDYATIKTAILEDMIGLITFNRPEVLNALNTATVAETLEAVRDMQSNPAVRVLVFTGEGRSFVAGADIQEMLGKTPDTARMYSELGHMLFTTIQDMDKPAHCSNQRLRSWWRPGGSSQLRHTHRLGQCNFRPA